MNELFPIIRRKRRPLLPMELLATAQIPVADQGVLAAPEPVKVSVVEVKPEPNEIAHAAPSDI